MNQASNINTVLTMSTSCASCSYITAVHWKNGSPMFYKKDRNCSRQYYSKIAILSNLSMQSSCEQEQAATLYKYSKLHRTPQPRSYCFLCFSLFFQSRVKQKPKIIEAVTTDKEHVNVVFIGHVGKKAGVYFNFFELETTKIIFGGCAQVRGATS